MDNFLQVSSWVTGLELGHRYLVGSQVLGWVTGLGLGHRSWVGSQVSSFTQYTFLNEFCKRGLCFRGTCKVFCNIETF